MYDAAIIGAGVIGAMICRELSRYKLNICIIEKENDASVGSTKANSGIVHAGFDAAVGSLKARFNVAGSEMMEKVCSELGVKYKKNGSLVVGFNGEDRDHLEELLKRGLENGVKKLRIIEKDELLTLEPNISEKAVCALYAPTGAIVCPYELCIAAVGNAMDNGAELFCGFEVADIENVGGSYTITSADGRKISSRYIVNAAGIYADKVASTVGDCSFKIHPRRGEYILLDRECGNTVSHTVFRTPSKMGKGILVTPTVDGNLLIGPTSKDSADKDDRATSDEGLSLLMKKAGESLSVNIPFGKAITSFTGLRAVGDTGDFIINKGAEHFINAAGIESPGLTSAPAIAEYVCELLRDDGLTLEEKEDFDPIREPKHAFREGTIDEKNEIIKKDPAYGHIICRCESISEGEILDAIRSNPPANDIDGVKRRTRAGMGRCQGGFCGAYVMELIAKERGIPYEEVTKNGGSSVLVYGRTK